MLLMIVEYVEVIFKEEVKLGEQGSDLQFPRARAPAG
jgi:hypothetical protein